MSHRYKDFEYLNIQPESGAMYPSKSMTCLKLPKKV